MIAKSQGMSLIRISQILLVLIGITPLVVIGRGAVIIKEAIHEGRRTKFNLLVNQTSDSLLRATWEFGRERAETTAGLANGDWTEARIKKLNQLRSDADAEFAKSMDLLLSLEKLAPENLVLKGADIKIIKQKTILNELRETVSDQIANHIKTGGISTKEYSEKMSAFVDGISAARISTLTPSSTEEHAIYTNIYIKQILFLAAEYASRERSYMIPFLTNKKPLDNDSQSQLKSWRALVDDSMRSITFLKDMNNFDAKLKEKIGQMEAGFLNKWEDRRTQVFAAAETGRYPITPNEWIEEASDAIQTIVAVTEAASSSPGQALAMEAAKAEKTVRSTVIYVAFLFVAVFIFVFFSYRYLTKTLLSPISRSMLRLGEQSDTLQAVSNEISSLSQKVSSTNHEQAAAIQEAVSAMSEMGSMIFQTHRNAKDLDGLSKKVLGNSIKGKDIMHRMVTAMHSIQQISTQLQHMSKIITDISTKTAVINDIVFKTQLLSFNASIEAARAGQHGRGFAVVAEEVGNLAQMSGASAKEIQTLLHDSQYQVQQILEVTKLRITEGEIVCEEAVSSFNDIAKDIEVSSSQIQAITSAAKEQEQGINQATSAMTQMDHAAQNSTSSVQHVTQLVSELKTQSDDLKKLMTSTKRLIFGLQNAELPSNKSTAGSGKDGSAPPSSGAGQDSSASLSDPKSTPESSREAPTNVIASAEKIIQLKRAQNSNLNESANLTAADFQAETKDRKPPAAS